MRKKENRKSLTVVASFTLAATIALSSVFTVAAAALPKDAQVETKTQTADEIVVDRNENGYTDSFETFEVSINQNGSTEKVTMAGGTVADALAKAEIHLDETMAVVPTVDTPLEKDMSITIQDGAKVTITADGITKQIIAPKVEVVNALVMLGYEVSEDDILSVAKNAVIKEDMDIVVQRVTYKTVTETKEIPFEVETEYTYDLEPGETQVETKGKNGKKEIVKEVMLIDGKESKSKVLKEKVVTKPVTEFVYEGIEPNIPFSISSSGSNTFTDTYGNTVGYSYVLSGSGTAYTSDYGALTATGVPAYVGGVAVNPNIIPYGSKLYIETTDGFVYGYATAVDTGGALMDGSALVDLYYTSYSECINFGRRTVNVYVLE